MSSSSSSSSSCQDQLLLTLAHGPLSPQLLQSVVQVTAEQCQAMRQAMQTIKNNNKNDRVPTQRLLLTGNSRVSRPGRELPEWQPWSSGEVVLNQIVERVGLDKFHLVGADVKLQGHLIDIFAQSSGGGANNNENNPHNGQADWRYAAARVERHLRIQQAAPLTRVVVVVPLEKTRGDGGNKAELTAMVHDILTQVWSQRPDGPLNGVPLTVELVC